MPLPGRQANLGSYRYGFQNQETDPEMLGGAVAFKYRVHDARIGRFLSIDPLTSRYPYYTPYSFSGNRVIDMIELEGLEPLPTIALPRLTLPRVILQNIRIPAPPTHPIPPVIPLPPEAVPIPQSPSIPEMPQMTYESKITEETDMTNPETWPHPPVEGEVTIGEPSRSKPRERGEKSMYDKDGGEWRPHKPDKYHKEGHWDYKPPGKNAAWEDVYLDILQEVEVRADKELTNEERQLLYQQQRAEYKQQMRNYKREMRKYEKDMKQWRKEVKRLFKEIEKQERDNPRQYQT